MDEVPARDVEPVFWSSGEFTDPNSINSPLTRTILHSVKKETLAVELTLAEIHRLINALHELIRAEEEGEGQMTDVDKRLLMKLIDLSR